MKYRTRIYYTEEQKTLMWDRWQEGESLSSIARLFDRNHSSIEGILKQTGGIRPRPRRRSRLALTFSQREEISRGVVAGCSIRSMAGRLGRAPSTVSRELRRNGGRLGYRANRADQAAWERARRPKICKLVQNRELAHSVALNLKKLWSPEQIAGWLKRTYPDHKDFQVSDETIYKSLFIQARGALTVSEFQSSDVFSETALFVTARVSRNSLLRPWPSARSAYLKKELLQHLRRTRGMRRSRHHTQKTEDHGRIKDTVSIRERPASVEERAVPGHWEGDLLIGSKHSQIATLVERQTRYVRLVKVNSRDTETVIKALTQQARKLPRELYQSLTWDRGKELADHKRFSLDTHIKVYFCDPRSPWQRGSNENTNGLLRQYFPKGMDLSNVDQNKLDAVARQLNERPRKTLDFETPAERFNQCVASIG